MQGTTRLGALCLVMAAGSLGFAQAPPPDPKAEVTATKNDQNPVDSGSKGNRTFHAAANHGSSGGNHKASADEHGGSASGTNGDGDASASSTNPGESCKVIGAGSADYKSRGRTSASAPSSSRSDSFGTATTPSGGGNVSAARSRKGQGGGSTSSAPAPPGIPAGASTTSGATPPPQGPTAPTPVTCCLLFVGVTPTTPIPAGSTISGSTAANVPTNPDADPPDPSTSETAQASTTAQQFLDAWKGKFPSGAGVTVTFGAAGVTICGTCPLLISWSGFDNAQQFPNGIPVVPDTGAESPTTP